MCSSDLGIDKPALYALSELFIYPSFYEGFGFPVLEAMAMGTPVITSNRSSLPEIAENGALLVNPNQVEKIADGIKTILNNPKIKECLIAKGLKQAEKFSWEKTAREWTEITKKMI